MKWQENIQYIKEVKKTYIIKRSKIAYNWCLRRKEERKWMETIFKKIRVTILQNDEIYQAQIQDTLRRLNNTTWRNITKLIIKKITWRWFWMLPIKREFIGSVLAILMITEFLKETIKAKEHHNFIWKMLKTLPIYSSVPSKNVLYNEVRNKCISR